jgi:hypothetical protein
MCLLPEHRRRLLQLVRSLPQENRTQPVAALTVYEQYPPGFGALLVRMLGTRNLGWTGSAKAIARPVRIVLPVPPSIPTLDERVLVIDKADGSLTRWPLMHLPMIEVQYARYKQNRPMTWRHPAGTPEYG